MAFKPLTVETALRRRCQVILSGMRRRARAEGKMLVYGLEALLRLAERRTCTYCRAPLALDFQIDHRLPIARGGMHALGNLCVVCARCNKLKGQWTDSEFRQFLALVASWHPAARQDAEKRLLRGAVVYTGSRRKKV